MSPNQVTEKNRLDVYKRLYPDINLRITPRLKVGDKVRLLREKHIFEKGYTQNWSSEIYTVYSVHEQNGVDWYFIKDTDEKNIPGLKYYWQLSLVAKYAD